MGQVQWPVCCSGKSQHGVNIVALLPETVYSQTARWVWKDIKLVVAKLLILGRLSAGYLHGIAPGGINVFAI